MNGLEDLQAEKSAFSRLTHKMGLTFLSIGIYEWVNSRYMEDYLEEVRGGIRLLEQGMQQNLFERRRNELFQHWVKMYEEDYCPSNFSDLFSFENEMRYLYLRVEIDEILSRKDQPFSDSVYSLED